MPKFTIEGLSHVYLPIVSMIESLIEPEIGETEVEPENPKTPFRKPPTAKDNQQNSKDNK